MSSPGAKKVSADPAVGKAPAKTSAGLGAVLFDDDDAADSKSEASAETAPLQLLSTEAGKASSPYLQSFVPWPRSTPIAERALQILTGKQADPESEVLTSTLLGNLTAPERASLEGAATPLRAAVLTRWRLAVALDRKPAPGIEFEEAAVEKMLAEVDQVMQQLPLAESVGTEMQQALTSVRSALARDAVALSELSRRLTEALKSARARLGTGLHPEARRMTVDSSRKHQNNRVITLSVAVVVLALLVGLYYGMAWHEQELAARKVTVGIPAGTSGYIDSQTGLGIIQKVDNRFTESDLQKLKANAVAKGLRVKQMSTGAYVILPAERVNVPAR